MGSSGWTTCSFLSRLVQLFLEADARAILCITYRGYALIDSLGEYCIRAGLEDDGLCGGEELRTQFWGFGEIKV